MDTKKLVILFVMSLFLFAMSLSVSAAYNISVSLEDVNDTTSTKDAGVQYLNNGTYQFSFVIQNNAAVNWTVVNITLPTGFQFIASSNSTNSSQEKMVFTNASQSLTWNGSFLTNNTLITKTGSVGEVANFAFDALVQTATEGDTDFTIRLLGNCSSGFANDSCVARELFTLSGNISIDNTPPTLTSAVTKSGSTINVTFSEKINITATNVSEPRTHAGQYSAGFAASSFLVGVNNGSVWDNITYAVSTISPAAGEDSEGSLSVLLKLAAGFPVNYSSEINVSINGTVRDRAGNRMVMNKSGTNFQDALATDGASPELQNATYDYNTNSIVLTFNESVSATTYDLTLSGFNISSPVNGRNVTITGLSSNTTVGNQTTFVLNTSLRDIISAWRVPGVSTVNLNISFKAGFVADAGSNSVVGAEEAFDKYTNDTTNPTYVAASCIYSHQIRNLTLYFNETMDITGMTAASVTLGNASNIVNASGVMNSSNTTMGGATLTVGIQNATTVNITLTPGQQRNISSLTRGIANRALYFAISNDTFRDLAGNIILSNDNKSMVACGSHVTDNVAPTVLNVSLSNSTYTSGGLPYRFNRPLKDGNYTINVTFNEYMDRLTNVTLNYEYSSGTTNTTTCSWINMSIAQCWFHMNGTMIPQGVATIQVSVGKDLSGVNTMASNDTFEFVIDTVAPKVTRAYYIDADLTNAVTNFSATTGADYIVLEFNENVSVAGYTSAGGDPALAFEKSGSIFVLNVTNDVLNATNITSDNSTAGKYRIKIQLNDTLLQSNLDLHNLTIRGVYNPDRLANADPSGIDIAYGQGVVVDDAGNPAVPNTSAVDIADKVISFTKNSSQTISVPYCVNASLMDVATTGVTWACSSYTAGTWSNGISSAADLTPLKGYKCTVTSGDLEYYVYTRNQTSCGLNTVSLAQNWNLVAVDGPRQVNATKWFAGLGNGNQVSQWYTNIDPYNALKTDANTIAYTNETADPYVGYWAFTDFDLASKNWVGTGLY